MRLNLSENEARALVRAFRLSVTSNTETPGIETVRIFIADWRTLSKTANRLHKKLK